MTFPGSSWKAGRAEDWVKLSVCQATEPVCTGLSSAAKRRGDGQGGAGQGLRLRILCREGFQVPFVGPQSGLLCGLFCRDCHLGDCVGYRGATGGIGRGKNTEWVSFPRILFTAILLN